jgi:hypothetical protein
MWIRQLLKPFSRDFKVVGSWGFFPREDFEREQHPYWREHG